MTRISLSFFLIFALASLLAAEKKPPAQPININTATSAELQQLPGIGPTTAKAIVTYRTKNGPFRKVDELLIIRGLSRSKLRTLRPYLKVK